MNRSTNPTIASYENASFPQASLPASNQAAENTPISGLTMPRSFLRALALLKYAGAAANHDLARVDDERAHAIQRAALEVAEGLHDREFGLDIFQMGDGSATERSVNDIIARYAEYYCGLQVSSHTHINHNQCASRIITVSMQVAVLLDIHQQLLPPLSKLAETLKVTEQYLPRLAPLGEIPFQTAQQLTHWSVQIQQAIEQINLASQPLRDLSMVGNEHSDAEFIQHLPAYINNQTGLRFCLQGNVLAGIPLQDIAVALSGQFRILALSLLNICEEMGRLQQDKQPEPLTAAMACVQVIGNDAAITFATQRSHAGCQRMLSITTYNLLQSINLLACTAHLLAEWINRFNPRHPHNAKTHKE